ncbi:MAG: polymer-forming cytoskeletal protein [Geminicoccaceae bacterium]|nr:polymer-forming cytoskeletal protein [Geminicoccaceae bacterium]
MFRRKDNDPPRPDATPEPAATPLTAPATPAPRPMAESRPAQPAPEMPRRQVEMPTPTSSTPFLATGERQQPGTGAASTAPVSESAGKRLIVGQGISLSGEITACDRLIVEGSVQVTLNETKAIEIAESGRFTNGKAEVDDAEISGVYEGDLTVRNRLLIRSTGQVRGNVRFGELEIERGGRLSGSISMLEKGAAPTRSAPQPAPAATGSAPTTSGQGAGTGGMGNGGSRIVG